MGDWMGYKTKVYFLPFEEAKKFVHSLNLKSRSQWILYKRNNKIDNIPSIPSRIYKNKGWISWGDFLGTNTIATFNKTNYVFITIDEAKIFIQSLKFKNVKQYENYCRSGNKPDNIPSIPSRTYKNKGWISWGDFLGTDVISTKKKVYTTFKEARKFAHSLKLKSVEEWFDYCKSGNKPNNIPTSSSRYYKKKGWLSWKDFLGTN
jgi:hypothetical protein